jgi:hypothetical protein
MFIPNTNNMLFLRRNYWKLLLYTLTTLPVVYLQLHGCFLESTILIGIGFAGFLYLKRSIFYQRILFILFFSLFFFVAIPVLRPQDINYSAYYAIAITASTAGYVVRFKKVKIDLIVIYFLWFFINALIFWGFKGVIQNYSLLTIPFTALSLYYILLVFTKDTEIILFIKLLMVTVILEALIGISQSFFGKPIFPNIVADIYQSNRNYLAPFSPHVTSLVNQGTGTFEHFNGLGALLALTFPVFFGFWRANKTYLRFVIMCILFLGIVTTYSRGALLGAIIGTSFIIIFDSKLPKLKALALLSVGIMVLLFSLNVFQTYIQSTGNISSRYDSWMVSIDYALKNSKRLIFGFGIFFFREEVLGTGPTLSNLHSGQLQILLELGLLGFCIFMTCFINMFFKFFKSERNLFAMSMLAGIFSFFVHQLFDNAMFGPLGTLMFCFFAILKIHLNRGNQVILKWWYGNKI